MASHSDRRPIKWPPVQVLPHNVLGTGRSCTVKLGIDKDEYVAVKLLNPDWAASYRRHVTREIVHHQDVSSYRHPYIVQLKRVTLEPPHVALVLEYVNGKSLDKYMDSWKKDFKTRLPLALARRIFQQFTVALEFLHRIGKVNRDISLANILIDTRAYPPTAKLCDFSFVKDNHWDSAQRTQIGTALFAAPEIYTTTPGASYDGALADVWAAGVVLCMLVTGKHPFLTDQDMLHNIHHVFHTLINNATTGQLQLPESFTSEQPQFTNLLTWMLHPDPAQRFHMDDVLEHPWFLVDLPTHWLNINANILTVENNMNNSVGSKMSTEDVEALIDTSVEMSMPLPTPVPVPMPMPVETLR